MLDDANKTNEKNLFKDKNDERSQKNSVNNYMVFSVLTTIFWCFIFGIIAIIYSSKVSKMIATGDIDNAIRFSKIARNLDIIGIILGVLLFLVYSILAFMGAFTFYGIYY